MTSPLSPSSRARLEELLAAPVSPLPWSNDAPFRRVIDGAGSTDHMAMAQFDEVPDADLAVAAVNFLPHALAALRAVEELHVPDVHGDCRPCCHSWPCPTARALLPASPTTEETNR